MKIFLFIATFCIAGTMGYLSTEQARNLFDHGTIRNCLEQTENTQAQLSTAIDNAFKGASDTLKAFAWCALRLKRAIDNNGFITNPGFTDTVNSIGLLPSEKTRVNRACSVRPAGNTPNDRATNVVACIIRNA